jgi:hypothetical protein
VRQWLRDPSSIYQLISAWRREPSTQQRLVARAAEIGKQWSELPSARTRAVLTALIERVEVRIDQVDIQLRPTGLSALFDAAVRPSRSVLEEESVILSVTTRLRRAGMEIRMLIDRTDPFAAVKPDTRSSWSSGRAGSVRRSSTATTSPLLRLPCAKE